MDNEGIVYQKETDENGKTVWKPFSKLGARRAVLNDLSPTATFIAYNYNTPVEVYVFEQEARRILKEVEAACGWMYATLANPKEGEPEAWAEKLRACKTADEVRALLSSEPGRGPIRGRRTLDKKQGSFNQVTQAGAVKQDIIISAYKPNGGLEECFKLEAVSEEGVWDFVRTHLKQLSVFVSMDGKAGGHRRTAQLPRL